jgi:hypothetical protein
MVKIRAKHCIDTVLELTYLQELYKTACPKKQAVVDVSLELEYLSALYSQPKLTNLSLEFPDKPKLIPRLRASKRFTSLLAQSKLTDIYNTTKHRRLG